MNPRSPMAVVVLMLVAINLGGCSARRSIHAGAWPDGRIDQPLGRVTAAVVQPRATVPESNAMPLSEPADSAEERFPQLPPVTLPLTDDLVVELDEQGRVFIDGHEVLLEDLVVSLLPLATPDRVAYVHADEALPYGTVFQVLERIQQAGFLDVELVVE